MEWYVFAFGSAVLASVASLLEKKALLKENALEFSTVLGLFSVLVSLPILFFITWNVSFNILILCYAVSIFGAVAFYLVAKTQRHMDISALSPLLNFEPIPVLILAILLLGEKVSWLQILGILVVVAGGYLLELPKNLDYKKPVRVFLKSKYIHIIFLALILYAFSSLGDKIVLGFIDPLKYILIVQIFLSMNFVMMISIFQNGLTSIQHGIKKAWKYIFIMAIFTNAYRLLQAQAVSMVFVSLAIPIKRISTVISTFFGGEAFHEKRVVSRTLIAAVMLIGAVLIILG